MKFSIQPTNRMANKCHIPLWALVNKLLTGR